MHRFLALFWLFSLPALAATEDVFERYQDRIVQIRVLEASSNAKAGVGSGFVASRDGLIVTNYHVVADLILHPAQYRGAVYTADNRLGSLQLVDFDAVHDLALVRTDLPLASPLALISRDLPIGTRVFSVGTPLDLGFTIVEGTYNGLLKQSLYEKIHFTGSINPGMSGGPALLADGRVVGVNVATAGNQVSFLVPARHVEALLQRHDQQQSRDPAQLLAKLRQQLTDNQNAYMQRLVRAPLATTQLGPYEVPARIAPFIKCWGDIQNPPENRFDLVIQQCSSEDDLYISRSQESGVIHFEHRLLTGHKLNRIRFYGVYQAQFNTDYPGVHATEEDVTRYACHTDFVKVNGLTLKTALCLRGYRHLTGLYDAVLKAATLNENHRGVQTTLVLAGVSRENALKFTKRYLESFRWNP